MTAVLELTFGIAILLISISCLWRTGDWLDWLAALQASGRRAALNVGMLELVVGALFVGVHPVWSGWGAVMTIIAAAAMVEGAFYVLFPGVFAKVLSMAVFRNPAVIRVLALVGVLLAVTILYSACTQLV